MAGLAVTQAWGWEATAVALRGQGRVDLPGRDAWVAYVDGGRIATSAGLQQRLVEQGPGVTVRAVDPQGTYLTLRRGHDAPAATVLHLALTRDPDLATRDALFAIPDVSLVARTAPMADDNGHLTGQITVQAYRSSTGELAAEAVVEEEVSLPVGSVTLEVTVVPYVTVAALYSPGRWPAVSGLILLLVGIVWSIAGQIARYRGVQEGMGRTTRIDSRAGSAEGSGA
jgi:hypothetical protein